jgi:predicted  nucleic acid-binding Zn-ribbon protein
MAHQCVHCSTLYEDGSAAVLKGCTSCGGHFFFYITEEKLKKIQAQQQPQAVELTEEEKDSIEKDVREIIGVEDEEVPIVLDLESISIVKPGKYKIDIRNLFTQERPLIYKLEDGKYIVDLSSELARTIKDKKA